MGHYIRVLATSDQHIPYDTLRASLYAEHPAATLAVDAGSAQQWEQLLLCHPDSSEIAAVERRPLEDLAEEVQEFRDEIADCRPLAGRDWLLDYLTRVRAIYVFQLLAGTDRPKGWEILGSLKNAIRREAGGIIQADGEGFSNEEGYHILWQFSQRVTGSWWMAVLQNGSWVRFQMDLGNRQHREAFIAGRVPDGVIQK